MSTGVGDRRDADARRVPGAGTRSSLWDLVFALAAVVLAILRFLILRRGGAPATIDGGNWLAFADGMLGHPVRSSTIVYPPVVPLLTKASVAAFGLTDGVAVMGALSSLAPGAGMYLALRCAGPAGAAAAAGLLVLGASSVGEATAWGGFPQLIGLGLAPVAFVLFDRLLRTWSPRHALGSGLALMGILATSHLIGAVALLAVVLMLSAGIAWPLGPIPGRWHRAGLLGLVLLPSLWLAPLYWSLARAFAGGSGGGASPNRLAWSNLLERIEFLYRDTPWLWRILLPLAVIAPFVLWRRHRTALWRLTAALLVATVLLTAVTREDRFLYLLTPLAALGAGLWIDRGRELPASTAHRSSRSKSRVRVTAGAMLVIMVGALAFQFVRSTQFFEQQRQHYGILTPGLVAGIEHLRESTEPEDTVAVTSLRNAPLGWWVEAIAQRPTIYGSPLGWLAFDDEIRRASLANDLFVPPFPTVDKVELAQNAGIRLILLPTGWTFYDPAAVDSLAHGAPGAVLYPNSSAVIIRADPTGS